MKVLFSTLGILALAAAAHAQFYAPDTDFHDPSQRFFPVEAARVLAWDRNANHDAHIAEVTYQLENTPQHESVWSISWLGADKAVLRQATIRYPENALVGGADWYHSVWRQLEGKDWTQTAGAKTDLSVPYWQGAAGAGLSRASGCTSALKLLTAAPKMDKATDAAKLAGTLLQSALPIVGSTVTLDGVLLARSAAWLCVAEERNGAEFHGGWGPILMLSSRDPLAPATWKKGHGNGKEAVERFWDIFIRFPSAREALVFITTPANRAYAGPLFLAYADTDIVYAQFFAEIGQSIVGDGRWKELWDYGTGINLGDHNRYPLAEHDAAARALRAWVKLLGTLPPAPGDATGVAELAAKIHDFDKEKKDLKAPSADLIALLNYGLENSAGPLIPTAVVTVRDVLGLGWEEAGPQIKIMANMIGVLAGHSAEGRDLAKAWATKVAGWDVFFPDDKIEPFKPLPDMGRYQCIASGQVAAALIARPPASWGKDADAYFRRRWLVAPSRALEYYAQRSKDQKTAGDLLRRAFRETGQRTLGSLLERGRYRPFGFEPLLDDLGMREEIARLVPENIRARQDTLEAKFAESTDHFAHAQALERLMWETGQVQRPAAVFMEYLRANATTSAKRYYDRVHDAIPNKYDLQTGIGAANFALALLEKDMDRLKRTADDCLPTFGKAMELAYALKREDLVEARKIMDERVKMGDPRGVFAKVRDYLALVPALMDAKDPRHREAVESFPETSSFRFVQWVLFTKAALPPDEAVKFFGGDDADETAKPFIAVLQKKKEVFERLYERNAGRDNEMGALYTWLHNLVNDVQPPAEEPDLMPAGATLLFPQLKEVAKQKK